MILQTPIYISISQLVRKLKVKTEKLHVNSNQRRKNAVKKDSIRTKGLAKLWR